MGVAKAALEAAVRFIAADTTKSPARGRAERE